MRRKFHINELAAILGNGETGWRPVDILKTVGHNDGWTGKQNVLGASVAASRARVLASIAPSIKNVRKRTRMEDHVDRYTAQSQHPVDYAEALRKKTRHDLARLVEMGLVTSTKDGRGTTTVRVVRGVTFRRPDSVFLIPDKVVQKWPPTDRIRQPPRGAKQCQSECGSSQQKCGSSQLRVQIVPAESADRPTLYKEDQVDHVTTRSDVLHRSEGTGGSAAANEPVSNPKDSMTTLEELAKSFEHPEPSSGPNPLCFLTARGVPPYPGIAKCGGVSLPAPPLITAEMTQTQRIELLTAAYRAGVREMFYRLAEDENWRPPKPGFWPRFPKPPKPGKKLTPGQIHLLDCARLFLKHNCPPHVWAMHMARAWSEVADRSLDKAPPLKYIYSPRVIGSRGSWGRHLQHEYTPQYEKLSPKGEKLRNDWLAMQREFQVRGVDSSERAKYVANLYFPDDEYSRRCDCARDEAEALTEMYQDLIKTGDWVWPSVVKGRGKSER